MTMDEKEFWKGFQGVMGYTDDEIEIFKSDPKENVISNFSNKPSSLHLHAQIRENASALVCPPLCGVP